MRDEPLFEVPEQPPVKRPKSLRELAAEAKLKFTRIRLRNRLPCDACIQVLHEAGGKGPYAGDAKWRMTGAGRGAMLLCHNHAAACKAQGGR